MKSYHSCFLFSKCSSSETKLLAENFRTQWPGGDTKPVHVTGDMEKYLTTEATKDHGLRGFNKHDLIAATFAKENGTGRIFSWELSHSSHISRKLKKNGPISFDKRNQNQTTAKYLSSSVVKRTRLRHPDNCIYACFL